MELGSQQLDTFRVNGSSTVDELWVLFHGAEVAVQPIERFLDHFVAGDIVASIIQDAALVFLWRAE